MFRTLPGHIVAIVEPPGKPNRALRRAVRETLEEVDPNNTSNSLHLFLFDEHNLHTQRLQVPKKKMPYVAIYKPAGRTNTPPKLVYAVDRADEVNRIIRHVVFPPTAPITSPPRHVPPAPPLPSPNASPTVHPLPPPKPKPRPTSPKMPRNNNSNNAIIRRHGFDTNALVANAFRTGVSLKNPATLKTILNIKYDVTKKRLPHNRSVHTAYGLARSRLHNNANNVFHNIVQNIEHEEEEAAEAILAPVATPAQKRAWTIFSKSLWVGAWDKAWWVADNLPRFQIMLTTVFLVIAWFSPGLAVHLSTLQARLSSYVPNWIRAVFGYVGVAAGAEKTFKNGAASYGQAEPLDLTSSWWAFPTEYLKILERSRWKEATGNSKALFRRWVEDTLHTYETGWLRKVGVGFTTGKTVKNFTNSLKKIAPVITTVFHTSAGLQRTLQKLGTMPSNSTELFTLIRDDHQIRSLYDNPKAKSDDVEAWRVFSVINLAYAKGNVTLATGAREKKGWRDAVLNWTQILNGLPPPHGD